MKDAFYFSHDYGARNDPKIQHLMMVHGLAGVGAYWCIIELLYEQNGRLKLDNIKMIAYTLHCKVSLVESLINDFDLFQHDDTYFWSKSLDKRVIERNDISEKRRKSVMQRWDKQQKADTTTIQNEYNCNTNVLQNEYKADTTTIQNEYNCNTIKEKEKEKKIEKENPLKGVKEKEKEKTVQQFFPPTQEEVLKYMTEKGYMLDPEAFIAFYDSKGWYVGKNKMKDWKAAVVTWAKREKSYNGKNNPNPRTQLNTKCNDEWQ